MGRGRSKSAAGTTNPKVEQALRRVIARTSGLKNEQYRIIDEEGNVVLEKRGTKHEVASTVGEKRQFLDGATSIHNHPSGGTFSSDDLGDFGYGAREIVIAAPNGEWYRLKNIKYGTKQQFEGWHDFQEAIERDVPQDVSFSVIQKRAEEKMHKTKLYKDMTGASAQWVKRRAEGASEEELSRYVEKYNKLSEEYKVALQKARRSEIVRPHHEYFKKNAEKYGFKYTYHNPT